MLSLVITIAGTTCPQTLRFSLGGEVFGVLALWGAENWMVAFYCRFLPPHRNLPLFGTTITRVRPVHLPRFMLVDCI